MRPMCSRRSSRLVAAVLASGSLLGAQAVLAQNVDPFVQQVNEAFNVSQSTIVTLQVDAEPSTPLTAVVPIDGVPYTLNLVPHSVRADDYQLLIQLADGTLVPMTPGPVRTLRGTALEMPGSIVSASLMETGLRAQIVLGEQGRYFLQPLADATLPMFRCSRRTAHGRRDEPSW